MKKVVLTLGTLSVLVLAITLACKKPLDGIKVIFSSDFADATSSYQFIDAKTGEQIGFNSSAQVTVELFGDDVDLIVDNGGSPNPTPNNGFLTLATRPDVTVSSSDPVEFKMVARAPGYLPSTVRETITQSGTKHTIVRMVNLNNSPDGTAVKVDNSLSSSGGQAAAEVTVTTDPVASGADQLESKVTIPAGTELLDKNGNPVNGQIESTLVYFNSEDEGSLSSFPGGGAIGASTANGVTNFKTAGFISMEMTGGGKEIKNFGASSIQTTIGIGSGTTDGDGNPVGPGSTIPVWSFDDEEGVWTEEGTATVADDGSGGLEATFNMNHLSYWSLCWSIPFCPTGATVNVVSNYTQNQYGAYVLKLPNGTYYGAGVINLKNGTNLTLTNMSQGQALEMTVYESFSNFVGNIDGTTISLADPCSGSQTVTINNAAPVTVSVTVNATCASNPGQVIRPTATIFAKQVGAPIWNYIGEMVDGKISTDAVKQGISYQVSTILGTDFYEAPGTYTVDQTEYVVEQAIPDDICAKLN